MKSFSQLSIQVESTGHRGLYLSRVSKTIYDAFAPKIFNVLKSKQEGTFVFTNSSGNFFMNLFDSGKVRAVATAIMAGAGAAGLVLSKRPDIALAAGMGGATILNYVSKLFKYHTSYKVKTPNIEVDGETIKIEHVVITLVISEKYKGKTYQIDYPDVSGAHNDSFGGKLIVLLLASTETPIEEIKNELINVIEHEVTHQYQHYSGLVSGETGKLQRDTSTDYVSYRQLAHEVEAWFEEFKKTAKRNNTFVGNILQSNMTKSRFDRDKLLETMKLYINHAIKFYPNDVFYRDKQHGDFKPAQALKQLLSK